MDDRETGDPRVASRIGRLIPWEYDYKYDSFMDKHYGESFPPATPPGDLGAD